MDYEIRADGSLHIEGYVNAVERDSRIVICPECGKCVEQIRAGAFGKALRAAKNVDMLLNHDKNRKIGSTSQGNLILSEDNIGLRASADITDAEVIEKAHLGKLKGWSFGFRAVNTDIEQRSGGVPRRYVNALSISEVSIIDDRFTPCYAGTSIEVRADGEELLEMRYNPIIRNHNAVSDNSEYIRRYNKIVLNGYRLRAKMLGVLPWSEEQRGNGRNCIKLDNGRLNGSRPSGNSGNNSSGKHLTNGARSGKIKATPKQRQEMKNVLNGTKTPDGIIISDVSQHAADRILERGYSAEYVKNAFETANITYPGNKSGTHCIQCSADDRIVYSDSGNIVSVVKLKKKGN